MTADELRAMRKAMGLSQAEIADKLGLSPRGYLKLESGEAKEIRGAYPLAAERLSLTLAVERGDPMLAAPGVRAEAFALVGMVTGQAKADCISA